jgi:hypothetical protein
MKKREDLAKGWIPSPWQSLDGLGGTRLDHAATGIVVILPWRAERPDQVRALRGLLAQMRLPSGPARGRETTRGEIAAMVWSALEDGIEPTEAEVAERLGYKGGEQALSRVVRDVVGGPREKRWTRFVARLRRLHEQGVPRLDALKLVETATYPSLPED